jgi:glucose/arabinose dehydrogenase
VVEARDGSLLVSDDGGDVVWRLAYSAGPANKVATQ